MMESFKMDDSALVEYVSDRIANELFVQHYLAIAASSDIAAVRGARRARARKRISGAGRAVKRKAGAAKRKVAGAGRAVKRKVGAAKTKVAAAGRKVKGAATAAGRKVSAAGRKVKGVTTAAGRKVAAAGRRVKGVLKRKKKAPSAQQPGQPGQAPKAPLVTRLRTRVAGGVRKAAGAVRRAKQRILPGRRPAPAPLPYQQGVPPPSQPQPQPQPGYPEQPPQPPPAQYIPGQTVYGPTTYVPGQTVYGPTRYVPGPTVYVAPTPVPILPPGTTVFSPVAPPQVLSPNYQQMGINIERMRGRLISIDPITQEIRRTSLGTHYIYSITPPAEFVRPPLNRYSGEKLYYGYRYKGNLTLDEPRAKWWIKLPLGGILSEEYPYEIGEEMRSGSDSEEEESSFETSEEESLESGESLSGDEYLATDSEEESSSSGSGGSGSSSGGEEEEEVDAFFEFKLNEPEPTTDLTPAQVWMEIRGNVLGIVKEEFEIN